MFTYHFSAAADSPASFCTLKQFSFETILPLLLIILCRASFTSSIYQSLLVDSVVIIVVDDES